MKLDWEIFSYMESTLKELNNNTKNIEFKSKDYIELLESQIKQMYKEIRKNSSIVDSYNVSKYIKIIFS